MAKSKATSVNAIGIKDPNILRRGKSTVGGKSALFRQAQGAAANSPRSRTANKSGSSSRKSASVSKSSTSASA